MKTTTTTNPGTEMLKKSTMVEAWRVYKFKKKHKVCENFTFSESLKYAHGLKKILKKN